jgi:hypothetical protein
MQHILKDILLHMGANLVLPLLRKSFEKPNISKRQSESYLIYNTARDNQKCGFNFCPRVRSIANHYRQHLQSLSKTHGVRQYAAFFSTRKLSFNLHRY